MMKNKKLVRRTTGNVLYDVFRREYPNRLGYSFGGSVAYIGTTEDGTKKEIVAKQRSKYIDGFSIGDVWGETGLGSSRIVELEQLSKNVVLVSYQYNSGKIYTDETEGRIVEKERAASNQ